MGPLRSALSKCRLRRALCLSNVPSSQCPLRSTLLSVPCKRQGTLRRALRRSERTLRRRSATTPKCPVAYRAVWSGEGTLSARALRSGEGTFRRGHFRGSERQGTSELGAGGRLRPRRARPLFRRGHFRGRLGEGTSMASQSRSRSPERSASRSTEPTGAASLKQVASQALGQSAEFRAGDWECRSCGRHVFGSRMQCKCGQPKALNAVPANQGVQVCVCLRILCIQVVCIQHVYCVSCGCIPYLTVAHVSTYHPGGVRCRDCGLAPG